MQDDYQALLQSVGIDKNQFNLREDNQSEMTFKHLHPDIQIVFQRMMKVKFYQKNILKQLFIENNKSKPISHSNMLHRLFLTPEKKQRSQAVSKPRWDLISTLNQSSFKKSIRSVDRTVSEFRYEISRNGKRSANTLNKVLGLANTWFDIILLPIIIRSNKLKIFMIINYHLNNKEITKQLMQKQNMLIEFNLLKGKFYHQQNLHQHEYQDKIMNMKQKY
ncbi:unnamed protein product (macronuclear) [Paramecium tetraurelia]|uniref:Uncharacterized protein n=1 Tax=Paramecium tetraurelia TaxID=5888 RepID=A0BUA7_PARTE|nr:uncharacterized protein GSPATT00032356001 [Paramecium tetraurelia]CAK62124.1 unnamed protein product [Paramecium tetraurelia]|eukprot:XP_001429522.1 hypothetical protein (macronuclear) [Paramecium tetraurelia strain d4-2]